ncbi:MAG: type II toxin-antitoxin system RelE/ParE family toxin [Ignavibacteria bacterium]|nr:type II toxin-antitoxin system RelE/ParE family toxin [Ignavibacteria bacterium]
MKVRWTRESLIRLREVKPYISKDNPQAAAKFLDKIINLAESIKENPEKGRIVPEITISNIRELLYKNYRIVYIIKKESIDILTVFEGHKLLEKDVIN